MDFKKSINLYNKIVSFCTLGATALLLLCFFYAFDAEKGYFTGGFLPIAFTVVFTAGIITSLLGATSFARGSTVKTPACTSVENAKLAFASTVAILLACFNFIMNKNEHPTVVLLTSLGVFALGIYFLITAAKGKPIYSSVRLICLLVTSFFPVGMMLGNNSNYFRSINSVENHLSSVFSICLLAYILYEGKYIFHGAHSGLHFSTMMLASHAGITLSSAYMLAYLLEAVNEETRFYQMMLTLVISILIKLKLDNFINTAESKTNEEWDLIEKPPVEEEADKEADIEADEEAVIKELMEEIIDEIIEEDQSEEETEE